MNTQKQTAHTPGPWIIGEAQTGEPHPWNEGEADYERAIFGADGSKIAVCEQWHPVLDSEAEANARLIAEAPALLAALEAIADTAHRASNGGLDTAGRKATSGDLKAFIRVLRDNAYAAIAAARGDAS